MAGSFDNNSFSTSSFDETAFDFGVADVIVNLTGVAASPAIGTGTVQIQTRISHATDSGRSIRRRKPVKVEAEGVLCSAEIGRIGFIRSAIINGNGNAAVPVIGLGATSIDFNVSTYRRRKDVITSQINVTFDGQPMPSASVGTGTGSITTEVDLFPEELAALLQ